MVPENTVAAAIPGQKVKTRICDLDSKDPLWSEHKGSPFPTVAEAIQEDLDKYRYGKVILFERSNLSNIPRKKIGEVRIIRYYAQVVSIELCLSSLGLTFSKEGSHTIQYTSQRASGRRSYSRYAIYSLKNFSDRAMLKH